MPTVTNFSTPLLFVQVLLPGLSESDVCCLSSAFDIDHSGDVTVGEFAAAFEADPSRCCIVPASLPDRLEPLPCLSLLPVSLCINNACLTVWPLHGGL